MSYINLLDVIYPVGSIYLSRQNVSPAQLIGGTWETIDEAVIRCSSSNIGIYLGEDTHTLTVEEMPSHNHHITRGIENPSNLISASGYDYGVSHAAGETAYTGGGQASLNHTTFLQCLWVGADFLKEVSFYELY